MVVHAPEVDFAIGGGVGDHHGSFGEPRSAGIGFEQGRTERRLPGERGVVLQCCKGFGTAGHPRHRRQRNSRRPGPWERHRRFDRKDLHRRHFRTQTVVGDHILDGVRSDVRPEPGDRHHSRRCRDSVLCEQRPCRTGGGRIEVGPHHHVGDALPGKGRGQSGRRPAVGDGPLHRVQGADGAGRGERDGITNGPRLFSEYLQRFVTRQAPGLIRKRRPRNHQCAPILIGAVVIEPRRRIFPVRRDRAIARGRRQPGGPHHRSRGQQGNHHDHCGRHRSRPFRVGEHPTGLAPADDVRRRHPGQQMGDTQGQRDTDQRVPLVHVAQWRAGTVEEHPHRLGDR